MRVAGGDGAAAAPAVRWDPDSGLWLPRADIIPFGLSSSPPARLPAPEGLTDRAYALIHHAEQWRCWTSRVRFRTVPAGRRSGKTELAKRFLVGTALCAHREANLFAGAPTWAQAHRIWWDDLVALVPPILVAEKRKAQGEAYIRLVHGPRIWLLSGEAAHRQEGVRWDGGVLDEYGNMPEMVWDEVLRPALAETGGWCWFIGVPEGRNHYYRLHRRAQAQGMARRYLIAGRMEEAEAVLRAAYGDDSPGLVKRGIDALEWDAFTWVSADILPAHEVEAAKRDMPPDLFEQEFEARFTAFRGRAYKDFSVDVHCAPIAHRYNPRAPLGFCLDFNVEPGAAAVVQEMQLPVGGRGTGVIGEVHIPYDSTTEQVCRRLVQEWEGHAGTVVVFGDATGGQRRTSAPAAGVTDWKIARQVLGAAFPRITWRVPNENPAERDRVNTLNARIRSAAGEVRLMVDPVAAPHVVEDLEGVRWKEGTGELAKTGPKNKGLTHWTDALGYYVHAVHPIPDHSASARKTTYAPG